MNTIKLVTIFMLTIFSTNLLAYGSSSSKKACKKPKISQFTPIHLSVVAPQSEFSFKASALTNPESVQVNIKKLPVSVTVKEEGNAYLITGSLPAELQDTYARVSINATGTNGCKATEGWLLKIESVQP
jgi:hypothetical protein